MKRNRFAAIAAAGCLALLLGGSAARAQSTDASAADKKFVKDALQGGMAEVKLGQLATQKSNSSDVKEFGQKMVDDHTKLGDQMKQVAGQVGVTPPDDVSMMDKTLATKLEALSGDDFDKAYIKAMLKDHRKDLADFRKEASTGTNSSVKDAASQGSQVIAEHLKLIRQIAQTHGVPLKTMASAGPKQ